MTTAARIGYLLAPAGLAAATVLNIFAEDAALLSDLWRPLAVAVAVTVVAQALATEALRDPLRGAYAGSVFVAIIGHVYWLAGILLALPAWWWVVSLNRRRTGKRSIPPFRLDAVARAVGILAAVFLVISIVRVTSAISPWTPDVPARSVDLPGTGGPDIFVLLLDGYPRADTLQNDLGIDNSPFLAALEDSGFVVDASSRANYMKTWLSVASMFHMGYVEDIPIFGDPTPDPAGQYRLASRAIAQAPFAEALRQRGYEIVAGTSPFTETDLMTADRVLDPGQPTNFENAVMLMTLTARIVEAVSPGFLAQLQVEQVQEGLDTLTSVARESSTRPLFMFAHVEAPHTPFGVDADGEPVPMPECFPISCSTFDHYITTLGLSREKYGERLAGYLAYTNQRVLEAIRTVVRERPDAVVIVMSDHGSRYDPDDPQEHFRNLFAARTPGVDDAFPAGTDMVNVFRYLSNAYFDTDFPALPYRAWFSAPRLFDLVSIEMPEGD